MKKILLLILPLFLAFQSCGPEEDTPNAKGTVTLGYSHSVGNGRVLSTHIDAVIVSIKDGSGNYIFNFERLNLVKIGENYVTQSIELEEGNYTVEDFIVVDSLDSAIYITPKVGSEFESLVNTPLPHPFTVSEGTVETVVLDVLDASFGSGPDFGYAVFTFNVVDPIDSCSLEYDPLCFCFSNPADTLCNHPLNGNGGFEEGEIGVIGVGEPGSAGSEWFLAGSGAFVSYEIVSASEIGGSGAKTLKLTIDEIGPQQWSAEVTNNRPNTNFGGDGLDVPAGRRFILSARIWSSRDDTKVFMQAMTSQPSYTTQIGAQFRTLAEGWNEVGIVTQHRDMTSEHLRATLWFNYEENLEATFYLDEVKVIDVGEFVDCETEQNLFISLYGQEEFENECQE